MTWDTATPNWETPAGAHITRFLAACRNACDPGEDSPLASKVTIFGSAVIQLRLDESFLSADADLQVLANEAKWKLVADRIGLGKVANQAGRRFYIEVCGVSAFRSTSIWLDRATVEEHHGFSVRIPSLRDILIGKLHRHRPPERDQLEPKDRLAFERVFTLTEGHPSEDELIEDLRLCPHAWHLDQGDTVTDFRLNVAELWPVLFHRELDVNGQIIEPLVAELEALGYRGTRDWIGLTRALRPVRR